MLWGLDIILTLLFLSDCLCQRGVFEKNADLESRNNPIFLHRKADVFSPNRMTIMPIPSMHGIYIPTFDLNLL